MIAHNFRSYGGPFILKYLLDNQHRGIKVIKRDTQLLYLQYRKADMNARSTLNFVQQKLVNFPKSVGLSDVNVKKGDFPHMQIFLLTGAKLLHFLLPMSVWSKESNVVIGLRFWNGMKQKNGRVTVY